MEASVVLSKFFKIEDNPKIIPLESGHINFTYRIESNLGEFILQRINTKIFKNPKAIAENHIKINDVLEKSSYSKKTAKPRLTLNDEYFAVDNINNEYWRMQGFLGDSLTYLTVSTPELAFEAAKCFSEFYLFLNQNKSLELDAVLPDFINFELRISDYKNALKNASEERLKTAEKEIQFINEHIDIPEKWINLDKQDLLPKRIIHADPKISNILFDCDQKSLAVIDLDTMMTSTLLYDFGDMIRSYTNLTAEDDASMENNFSDEIYEAAKKGFLFHLKDIITKTEIENLDYAARVIVYIQAIRFLTDFLNNDQYYATKYLDHNLDRTKNQINLLTNLLAKNH